MDALLTLVKDYLSQNNSDFAILINGQWGSGKTYFWKNTVNKTIQSIEYQKDKDGNPIFYEPVYISLFGVSSVTEMINKLSLEILPFKAVTHSKLGKFGGFLLKTVVSRAGNFFKLGGIGQEEESAFLELITNFKANKVLCFDDLERVKPEAINDILGYINQFVEHDHLKVILLADEKELLNTGNKLYSKMKEKLIRFTFQFHPDITEVFSNFLDIYANPQFAEFINKHKQMIITSFHNGEHKNMRSLRFILDLFFQIFIDVQNSNHISHENKEEALRQLLLFTVSYSIEYKKATNDNLLDTIKNISSISLPSEDMIDRMLNKESAYSERKSVTNSPEKEFSKQFKDNYLRIEGYDCFQFFESVKELIHLGFLNREKLDNDLNDLQSQISSALNSQEQILLGKLNQMRFLEDDELFSVVNETILKAKNGSFFVQSYPFIISCLIYIENQGLRKFKLDKNLLKEIIDGLHKSKTISAFVPTFSYTEFSKSEPRYNEVLELALKINNDLNESIQKVIAPDIIDAIRSNNTSLLKESLSDEKNVQYPILQYLSANDVLSALLQGTNQIKIAFKISLEARYIVKTVPEHLTEEIKFLKDLNTQLTEYLENRTTTELSTMRLLEIQKLLETLLNQS